MTTNYREILRLESLGLNKTDMQHNVHAIRCQRRSQEQKPVACGGRCRKECLTKDLRKGCFPAHRGKWSTRCRTTPMFTVRCSDRALR